MTEHLKQKLNDSAVLRWSVLALVAFTMLCGYFLTDVMSPLNPCLRKNYYGTVLIMVSSQALTGGLMYSY